MSASAPTTTPGAPRLRVNGIGLDPRTATLARDRLRVCQVTGEWLPEGLDAELDAARAVHGRLLRADDADVPELRALLDAWAAEDKGYALALAAAARDGSEPPTDDRPNPAERADAERPLLDRVEANIRVLAEKVEETIAYVRESDGRLLAQLEAQAEGATAKREEAARLLEEARMDEWHPARTAK